MKKRWIILALDGFDELAARIGVRDAFLGISDLIDQLDGNGDIILSARDPGCSPRRASRFLPRPEQVIPLSEG